MKSRNSAKGLIKKIIGWNGLVKAKHIVAKGLAKGCYNFNKIPNGFWHRLIRLGIENIFGLFSIELDDIEKSL